MTIENDKSSNKEAILSVLKTGNANKLNLLAAIYRIIDKAKETEQWELVKYTAEQIENVESSKQVSFPEEFIPITDNEKEELGDSYRKISDEMLVALISQNLEEKAFYEKVWDVVKNPFFTRANAKEFVFYNILIDSRIPYFSVDAGVKMGNDEFERILKKIYSSRAKARFILKRKFEQRTQRASNLIDLINSVESEEEKVVLMSYILEQASPNREAQLLRALRSAE